ncbi:unnamed protein product [Ectocarpus sp. 8 AP-2014]
MRQYNTTSVATKKGPVSKCETSQQKQNSDCKQTSLSGNARYFTGDTVSLLSRKRVTSLLHIGAVRHAQATGFWEK